MSRQEAFEVVVPATLSNLGPGYDVLGLALDWGNRFTLRPTSGPGRWTDLGRPVDAGMHALFAAVEHTCAHLGRTLDHGLDLVQDEQVPRARGLGSSATARVAGVLAAAAFLGEELGRNEVFALAAELEGHPDNAAPAALGGLCLCLPGEAGRAPRVLQPPVLAELRVALCIPERRVATATARAAMPARVSVADAVFTSAHLGALLTGLVTGDLEALAAGLRDRLHTPVRAPLVGPLDAVDAAARSAGALPAFISGSGSTLAAFVPPGVDAPLVAEAMCRAYRPEGGACAARACGLGGPRLGR